MPRAYSMRHHAAWLACMAEYCHAACLCGIMRHGRPVAGLHSRILRIAVSVFKAIPYIEVNVNYTVLCFVRCGTVTNELIVGSGHLITGEG